jgi:hypothetical protein
MARLEKEIKETVKKAAGGKGSRGRKGKKTGSSRGGASSIEKKAKKLLK